jgi:hypothetical protein
MAGVALTGSLTDSFDVFTDSRYWPVSMGRAAYEAAALN